MSDAYKNTRTSHTAEDSAVLGHAGHTWPNGPKEQMTPEARLIDKHPEVNESLHRSHWEGNTLVPGVQTFTSYESNQENLTRGGLQVGKPVIGLSSTPMQGQTSLGEPLPTTGMQHGLQMPGQHPLPTDLKRDIQNYGSIHDSTIQKNNTLGSTFDSTSTVGSYEHRSDPSIPLHSGGLSGSLADSTMKPTIIGSDYNKQTDSVRHITNEDMLHQLPTERRAL